MVVGKSSHRGAILRQRPPNQPAILPINGQVQQIIINLTIARAQACFETSRSQSLTLGRVIATGHLSGPEYFCCHSWLISQAKRHKAVTKGQSHRGRAPTISVGSDNGTKTSSSQSPIHEQPVLPLPGTRPKLIPPCRGLGQFEGIVSTNNSTKKNWDSDWRRRGAVWLSFGAVAKPHS